MTKYRWLATTASALFWITAVVLALIVRMETPGLPSEIGSDSSGVFILTQDSTGEFSKVTIDSINGIAVTSYADIRESADINEIGDTITIATADGAIVSGIAPPRYAQSDIFTRSVLAAIFVVMALLLHLRGSVSETWLASSLYMIAFVCAAFWPQLHDPFMVAIGVMILFLLVIPQLWASMLVFAYHFPAPVLEGAQLRFRKTVVRYVAASCSIGLATLYVARLLQPIGEVVAAYTLARLSLEWITYAVVAWVVVRMIANTRELGRPMAERQLRWVVMGATLTCVPIVILRHVTGLFGSGLRIPFWVYAIFVVAVPVTTFLALMRPRVTNIDRLFTEILSYSAVLLSGIAVFLLVLNSFQSVLGASQGIAILFAVVAITLFFRPAFNTVTPLIRRYFFATTAKYRSSLHAFISLRETVGSVEELREAWFQEARSAIPARKWLLIRRHQDQFAAVNEFSDDAGLIMTWMQEYAHTLALEQIAGTDKAFEESIQSESLALPAPWRAVITIAPDLWCFMGEKKTEEPLWLEEIKYLTQLSREYNRIASWIAGDSTPEAAELVSKSAAI